MSPPSVSSDQLPPLIKALPPLSSDCIKPEYDQVIGLPVVEEVPGVSQVVGDGLDRSQQSHIHLVVLTLQPADNVLGYKASLLVSGRGWHNRRSQNLGIAKKWGGGLDPCQDLFD